MQEAKAVKPLAGLIVSLIAGILTILSGLAHESFMAALGAAPAPYGKAGFSLGILMVVGAVIGYRGRPKLGGFMVTIGPILNIFGVETQALPLIIMGIAGGVLILVGK